MLPGTVPPLQVSFHGKRTNPRGAEIGSVLRASPSEYFYGGQIDDLVVIMREL